MLALTTMQKFENIQSIEEITFVTLDFQNGYFTVYPTDTANAHPTLLTHCPIFLTHIYFYLTYTGILVLLVI